MKTIKLLTGVFAVLLLTGCSKIDGYFLGKDNTPPPKELKTFKPELHLSEPWSIETGDGNDVTYLEMYPALSDTVIFTTDTDGDLVALDRATGDIRWKNDLDTDVISGPAIDEAGENIAVTTKEAKVIVLDAATGKKRWQRTVSNEVFAPPTIAEGKIFVKTVDSQLYAFDVASGDKLWNYAHGATPLVMRAGSSPTVLMGVVVAGFADGKLVGIKADTGQVLWEKTVAIPEGVSDVERIADIDADPLIEDSAVYVASYQQNVSAMSLATGEFLWEKKELSTLHNMVIHQNTLYVVDDKSVIWAIDRYSGNVLWQLESLENRRLTAPAIVDGKALVVGDFQGFVHWLSLEDGHTIARARPSRSPLYAEPVTDDNNVYIYTSYGKLVAYQVTERAAETDNE